MGNPHNTWTFASRTTPWDMPEPVECGVDAVDGVTARVSFADRAAALVTVIDSSLDLDEFGESDARALAERIVDRLCFELDVALRALRLSGSQLRDGRTMQTFDVKLLVGQAGPSAAQVEACLGRGLGSDHPGLEVALHVYREARAARDPIAAFLLFWNLLVMLHDGSEPTADAAIRTLAPEAAVMPARRPRKGTVTEVLATRDDIAHMIRLANVGALSIPTLRTAVDSALPYLKTAVRKTVERRFAL